ncbi:MAG TPA: fluoride efflux transporter CrcB [Bacillales bacterium]|nr:fluoride efflux transporter CrcB [Bacillales bacterium]
MTYLLVGAAGMIGAFLRFYVGKVTGDWGGGTFPYGTFIVNMIGSFALGWFIQLFGSSQKLKPHFVTAIGTGLIGSFTTFSTFSVETVKLVNDGLFMVAFLYVAASLIGGLLLSSFGFQIGKAQSDNRSKEETI